MLGIHTNFVSGDPYVLLCKLNPSTLPLRVVNSPLWGLYGSNAVPPPTESASLRDSLVNLQSYE